ncbi:MAG: ubiquinone/menaquinone biosynthesis C-methylase UbiE [Acidimicrobiales bacterium]|jgi:ubiquinone/menaquinone biosynthesis C-methylase UbiE
MTDTNTAPVGVQGRFVEPGVVSTHFHIREGDTVADFGAGSGYFVDVLADLVGKEGTVYACEIQKDLSTKLGENARQKGLTQIHSLWSDVEELGGSKIPDGVLDAAIVVNAFFQFEEKGIALQEISRTMRSGGKLFIIDWSESFGGLGPQPGHVISEADAQVLAELQGFIFERTFDTGDHHYGLALRKV